MRVSEILVASLVAPLVAAHGGTPGAPKIFGLRHNAIADLKSRSIYGGHAHRAAQHAHGSLHARQGGADGRCGKDFGCATCDEGYCCSPGGWCGKGNDYCRAPDSLLDYGPGADANKVPSGGSTRNIARPKLGSISYGGDGIYACRNPGQIAITYDDGPYIYTSDLLDLFASYKFKATFFMTGINLSKGSIDDESTKWPALLRRMVSEGHQLASHTWSHQDLSAITQAQRYEQMVKLEMAMSNVIGKFPTYMRPPYSSCTAASGCEKDMEDLGYHVSYFDLDTDDYNNATPDKAQIPKDRVKAALDSKNSTTDDFLAIAHDIHDQTVHNLTSYMLDLMVKKGYKGVTMGECLGDPEENWYRSATGRVATTSVFTPPACASTISSSARSSASVSASPTSSSAIATPTAGSLDGSCGPTVGRTCLGFSGGECCSQYNYCGNTTGHCGVGCQSGFGKCDGSSSSGLASSSSVLASSQASSASLSNAPSSASNPSSTPGPSTKASSSSVAPSSAVTPPSTISSPARSSSAASSTIPSTTRSSTTPTQIPTPSPSPKDQISPNGTCGGSKGYTCAGSRFGDCCSTLGQCGSTLFSCSTWLGCNSKFGKCY